MAEAKGLPTSDIKAITDRVMALSQADYCRVNVETGWRGYTRVATNRITSAGGADSTTVNITSVFGKRVASISTNSIEGSDLEAAVRKSEVMAQLAPESPEYMPELAAQNYLDNGGYYDNTGELEPLTRAEAAAIAIRQAEAAGQIAASYMDVRAGTSAVATSEGLFGAHAKTGVAYTLTARTRDGLQSGWAGDEANDWSNIESQRVADDAVSKCQQWRKTELDPGLYTAILEPTAVGMLMLRMRNTFNQRLADEGRSYFSKSGGGNRLGEQLFDERVSIYSDPGFVDAETAPFTADGQALRATNWVENGRLTNLSRSRFCADQRSGATARCDQSHHGWW